MVDGKKQPDLALAERLYCRAGKRVTTIFYKHADGRNEIFASAPTGSKDRVAKAKIEALQKWGELRGMAGTRPEDKTVAGLFTRYFEWQEKLPENSKLKKAASTIETNGYEKKPVLAFFGAMAPRAVTATMIYEYVDVRAAAGAPLVAVKEVALLSAVFEFGRRKGALEENPCHGMKLEGGNTKSRVVSWEEIEFVTKVGRSLGGTYHLQAHAARAAWLAFKRPGEVLSVPKSAVTDEGLEFRANKRRRGQAERTLLLMWTPTFRETIDEALKIGRWQAFQGDRLIFGNLAGHRYSRSGWGTIWGRLMDHCARRAAWMEQPFETFAPADCRPGGVTVKKGTGQEDVYEGTGHADRRMVDAVYDRRPQRISTPAK